MSLWNINLFYMMKNGGVIVSEVTEKEEYVRMFGVELHDVRCRCGKKLCEVESRKGSVILIKCDKCKSIIRLKL